MLRTTGMIASSLLSFTLLVAAPSAVEAAEEDTQFWTILTVEGQLADDWNGSLEINPRLRSAEVGGDLVQARANIDYDLAPSIAVGGGALYAEFAGGNEFRTHQQLVFSTGQLAFRTRLEERFFAGADRMEVRLRQRIQAVFPLAGSTSLVASGEALGILRSRSESAGAKLDQLRAQLLLRQKVTPRTEVNAGYLAILTSRRGQPDRLSHVPQIGLRIRL